MSDDATPLNIAVVDDDPKILESLEDLLESADHAVRTFTSATALLESGCLAKIDCLISDIGMPVMDGFELVRIARATRPTLPIILISGHPHLLRGLSPVLRGHYRVLKKPFDGQALLTAVSDALGTAG
ncbi:MAG: response regulator transcription factor [Burkholderiales bacterium]